MKRMLLSVVLLCLSLIVVGCGMNMTAKDAAIEYMEMYRNKDKLIMDELDDYVNNEDLTDKQKEIEVDNASFVSLLCLEGEVSFDGVTLVKGDCAFIPANRGKITFKGSATLIESRV